MTKTRSPSKDTFPHWIYSGVPIADPMGHGDRAVTFLRRLKHPKSALRKKAFQLDPWQERIVRKIYGPRHPDGSRIELPPNEWTPVVGSLSLEVLNGTCTSVVY